jgi:DNA-binding NtrC family response regulator
VQININRFFEIANNGTIYLDEIVVLIFSAQTSLNRVLENKEIQKSGSNLITNLKELVSQG